MNQQRGPDVDHYRWNNIKLLNRKQIRFSEPKSNFRLRHSTTGNPEALLERISRRSEATSNLNSVNEEEPCTPTSDQRMKHNFLIG